MSFDSQKGFPAFRFGCIVSHQIACKIEVLDQEIILSIQAPLYQKFLQQEVIFRELNFPQPASIIFIN